MIFDEIHHCAGSNVDNANAWGEQIILNIQDKAKYTLALTGTPWRSDAAPIVLSNYMHPSIKYRVITFMGFLRPLQMMFAAYRRLLR